MNINEDKYQYPLPTDVVKWRMKHVPDKVAYLFYRELREWDPSLERVQARHFPSYEEGTLWVMYDQAMEQYHTKL